MEIRSTYQNKGKLPPWLRTTRQQKRNKLVFLAYQDVFTGEKANITSHSFIKNVVSQYYQARKHLTATLSLDTVTKYLVKVLKQGWMAPNSGARHDLQYLFPSATKLLKTKGGVDSTTIRGPDLISEEHNSEYNPSYLEGEGESELSTDSLERAEVISRGQAGLDADGAGSQEDTITNRKQLSVVIRSGVVRRRKQKDIATPQYNLPAQFRINQASGRIQKPDRAGTKPTITIMPSRGQSINSAAKDAKSGQNYKNKLPAYPVPENQTCLPFKLQHRILNITQKILEESCFFFTKRWLPSVLEKNEWESAEAGELNLYCKHLLENKILSNASLLSNQDLSKLLNRVKHIRHAAVHRFTKIPIITVAAMVKDAAALASALQDEERSSKIVHWQRELDSLVGNLNSNMNTRRLKVEEELRTIRQRKAALEQEQAEIVDREEALERSLIGSSSEDINAGTVLSLMETFGVADNALTAIDDVQRPVSDLPTIRKRRRTGLSKPSPVDNHDLWRPQSESTSPEGRRVVTRSMTRERQL